MFLSPHPLRREYIDFFVLERMQTEWRGRGCLVQCRGCWARQIRTSTVRVVDGHEARAGDR